MSWAGTEEPRRKVGVGGQATRAAQSRGEWPGARRTFFEGREEAGREEDVGAREEVGGLRRREAAEGGGRRVDCWGFVGREGGGIRVEAGVEVGWEDRFARDGIERSGFRRAVGEGRGGEGIEIVGISCG